MKDGSGNISRIYTTTASGEIREDLIVDKDSVGKIAGKIAFSLTPLGMMSDAIDSTELSVCVPPGKIELLVEIKGARKVPKKVADGNKIELTLISNWNHKLPVELEAGGLYTIMNLGQLIVRSENGNIVGRSTAETLMEVSEFNERAFLLSKADRDLTVKGQFVADELGIKSIPVYADSENIIVILSGSLDLGQVVSGMAAWLPPDCMVVNVGKKPVLINDISLDEGEYIINQLGRYIKKALPE